MPDDGRHTDADRDPPPVLRRAVPQAASSAGAASARLRRLFGLREPAADLPPELEFLVIEGMARARLAPVAEAAAAAGVTGEIALFEFGVSDDRYYRLLARHLGVPYLERAISLAADGFDATAASRSGVAPLAANPHGLRRVHAPRGEALRLLLKAHHDDPDGISGFAVTTPRRLDALLRRRDEAGRLERAADGLANWDASLSARGGVAPWQNALALASVIIAVFVCAAAPDKAVLRLSSLLIPIFGAAVLQRLAVAAASPAPAPATPRHDRAADRDLPVYTVLVPLFREAQVLPQLVRALDAIDYPPSRLDIKILLEACDGETIAAAARLRLGVHYDVLVLGDGHPRTKPRALNAGLEWARGDYVVVYDAEDRPDPGQLRAAVCRFAAAPNLACLQARLAIDHADETWITRMFAMEYAALFGVVKPGLAALGLPIPLGGTSNHFRIAALRRVGGWDAWNVTEDIDLGFRLARYGFAVGSLDSTTFEEAPLKFGRWLPQRARWLKGWMVTLIVCGRDPVRLFRDLGWRDGVSVLVSLLGTVTSCLAGPPLLLLALVDLRHGLPDLMGPSLRAAFVLAWVGLFVAGAVAALWPTMTGLKRMGRVDLAVWILALPVYLLLVWVASWRALYEAWRAPQAWNKTEHGLARLRSAPRRAMKTRRRPAR